MTPSPTKPPGAADVTDRHNNGIGTPVWFRGRARSSRVNSPACLATAWAALLLFLAKPVTILALWAIWAMALSAALIIGFGIQSLRR